MAKSVFSGKMGIIIPAALALLAVLLTFQYIHQKERELGFLAEPLPVLVVNRNVPRLTRLDRTMLTVEQIPRRYVQPGALSAYEDAVDQVTIVPMLQGEQLLGTKLVAYGIETGLAVKIPKGLRAVTIGVTDESGVAGLIKPGDFVDVLGSFEFGGRDKSDMQTFTLYQSVLVLAVEQHLGVETDAAKSIERSLIEQRQIREQRLMRKDRPTVTLALLPDQAQGLVLAQETGYLYLTLRSMFEERVAVTLGSTGLKELLGLKDKVYVTPPRWREIRGEREGFGF
ncbi:Flp pilus assembly protein CpaB [Desulfonatronum thiodismutans]|uniref:Flp pilus assembly protein CpaB n=1 Tax=Desulfonatronum thiodismutans TaxID=159290 RepID=UPI0012695B5D|nr:Flp pilus assembly protein CpaB [Desulfonatronum thiodismutans]